MSKLSVYYSCEVSPLRAKKKSSYSRMQGRELGLSVPAGGIDILKVKDRFGRRWYIQQIKPDTKWNP